MSDESSSTTLAPAPPADSSSPVGLMLAILVNGAGLMVKLAALEALTRLLPSHPDPLAVPVLLDYLTMGTHSTCDLKARETARAVLAAIPEHAVPALLTKLKDPDDAAPLPYISALAACGDLQAAEGPLVLILTDYTEAYATRRRPARAGLVAAHTDPGL